MKKWDLVTTKEGRCQNKLGIECDLVPRSQLRREGIKKIFWKSGMRPHLRMEGIKKMKKWHFGRVCVCVSCQRKETFREKEEDLWGEERRPLCRRRTWRCPSVSFAPLCYPLRSSTRSIPLRINGGTITYQFETFCPVGHRFPVP